MEIYHHRYFEIRSPRPMLRVSGELIWDGSCFY